MYGPAKASQVLYQASLIGDYNNPESVRETPDKAGLSNAGR